MEPTKPTFYQHLTKKRANFILFWVLNITIIVSAICLTRDVNYIGPLVILIIAAVVQLINIIGSYESYKRAYR